MSELAGSLASIPRRRILGIEVHAVTLARALELCDEAIQSRARLNVGAVNAAKLVNMRSDALLRASVVESDLVIADGMSVVWAGRLLRQSLPERVTGIDLFERLLALANTRGYSVFLLGASTEVLAKLVARVQSSFPGVRIVGARDGYYPDSSSEEVAEEIRLATPDMLFLGMTSPKKELFLGRFKAVLGVPICHGVGGSFDVLAGKVRRAPHRWQRLGLEWLFRVVQEPRRMWKRYLVTNSLFFLLVVREILGFPARK